MPIIKFDENPPKEILVHRFLSSGKVCHTIKDRLPTTISEQTNFILISLQWNPVISECYPCYMCSASSDFTEQSTCTGMCSICTGIQLTLYLVLNFRSALAQFQLFDQQKKYLFLSGRRYRRNTVNIFIHHTN